MTRLSQSGLFLPPKKLNYFTYFVPDMEGLNKRITNGKSEAYLLEEDIFYIYFRPNTYSCLRDFKEAYVAYRELSEGRNIKVLIEFGKYAMISDRAREYAQENDIPFVAEAVVVTGLAQTILYRFYSLFRRHKYPLKMFHTKEDAIVWLNSFTA